MGARLQLRACAPLVLSRGARGRAALLEACACRGLGRCQGCSQARAARRVGQARAEGRSSLVGPPQLRERHAAPVVRARAVAARRLRLCARRARLSSGRCSQAHVRLSALLCALGCRSRLLSRLELICSVAAAQHVACHVLPALQCLKAPPCTGERRQTAASLPARRLSSRMRGSALLRLALPERPGSEHNEAIAGCRPSTHAQHLVGVSQRGLPVLQAGVRGAAVQQQRAAGRRVACGLQQRVAVQLHRACIVPRRVARVAPVHARA